MSKILEFVDANLKKKIKYRHDEKTNKDDIDRFVN